MLGDRAAARADVADPGIPSLPRERGEIVYAVPGNPTVAERTVQLLLDDRRVPPQPLVLAEADGRLVAALSKRTGDTALQDYRDKGYPREAIVNFLCLQGWALDGTTEIFSIEDLVRHFDVRDVNKAGAIFDIQKLDWLNARWIREKLSEEEFASSCDELAPAFAAVPGLASKVWLADRAEGGPSERRLRRDEVGHHASLAGSIARWASCCPG